MRTKNCLIVFRLIVFTGVIYILLMTWIGPLFCDTNSTLMSPSAHWTIDEATIPAEILWQTKEITPNSYADILSPLTGIALSDNTLLFLHDGGPIPCNTKPIVVAYKLSTGEESWRYRPDRLSPDLFSISNGYILVNPYSITRLDFSGNIVWQHEANEMGLPLRSVQTMYEGEQNVYFSTGPELYTVSIDAGEVIGTGRSVNALGVFDDSSILMGTGDNQIQLAPFNNQGQSLYSLRFPSSRFEYLPLNPLFPYTQRIGNTLLLFFDDMAPAAISIEAYEFSTGKPLWRLQEPFYGLPVIFENRNVFVLYNPVAGLEIRSISSGALLGKVVLKRDTENSAIQQYISDPSLRFSIAMVGKDDTVFIRWGSTHELVAVHMDLSGLSEPLNGS